MFKATDFFLHLRFCVVRLRFDQSYPQAFLKSLGTLYCIYNRDSSLVVFHKLVIAKLFRQPKPPWSLSPMSFLHRCPVQGMCPLEWTTFRNAFPFYPLEPSRLRDAELPTCRRHSQLSGSHLCPVLRHDQVWRPHILHGRVPLRTREPCFFRKQVRKLVKTVYLHLLDAVLTYPTWHVFRTRIILDSGHFREWIIDQLMFA